MSRRSIGWMLVFLAAVSMAINVFFCQSNEQYDLVRRITYGLFAVGILLIPSYTIAEK